MKENKTIIDYAKRSRGILMVLATVLSANTAMAYLGGASETGIDCDNETLGSSATPTIAAVWCQNCAATTPATCSLSAANGTCTYTTACPNTSGWTLNNSGKYNPSCTAKTFTVTLKKRTDTSGTTTTVDTVTATYASAMPTKNASNASLTMPTYSKAVFKGYYDGQSSGNGTGTQYYTAALASAQTWDKTAATTLYAKFADCTCTKGSNVASCSASGVTSNKCQYTYNCSSGYTSNGQVGGSASNLTFTASSAAVESNTSPSCSIVTYTITYDFTHCQGGNMTGKNAETTYQVTTADITLKEPNHAGWTFDGWYTDASFMDTQAVTKIAKGSTGNKTFYAKCHKSITYNTNGASSATPSATTCLYPETIQLPAAPTKSGYTFAGWELQ